MITTTRTVTNLFIQGAIRRPDGKVAIRFSIMKAGIYYNVRQFSKVFNKKFPMGFVMTPAIADPMHSRDPLMVPNPGAQFTYVWDAPRDGFGTGSLYGTTFQLAYVDFLCCDEVEGGSTPPPPIPPPPIPPIPPIPPTAPPVVPTHTVAPPSIPGMPTTVIPNPTQPPTIVNPPTFVDPNAGNSEPTPVIPGTSSGSGGLPTVDGGVPTSPVPGPVFPPWMPQAPTGSTQTPGGTPIVPAPTPSPSWFPYVPLTDVSPPQPPLSIGTPPPVKPPFTMPSLMTPEQQALMYHLYDYRPLPAYPISPGFASLFGLPENPST